MPRCLTSILWVYYIFFIYFIKFLKINSFKIHSKYHLININVVFFFFVKLSSIFYMILYDFLVFFIFFLVFSCKVCLLLSIYLIKQTMLNSLFIIIIKN